MKQKRILSLFVTLALLLTSCGLTRPTAATMHLRQTEGTVGVSDGNGEDIEPRDNLGLYSGYGVDTQSKSYAWVDLDEVKLTKLDENSEIEITKDGKNLEIEILSGSLFFNVTEPLADDETMTIRSSSMTVGIRGTCGWVTLSEDEETLSVYLLEGKVRCETDGAHETVRAGEMAVMTEDGEITVAEFSAGDVPDFVMEELDEEQVSDYIENGDLAPAWDPAAPADDNGATDVTYDYNTYIRRRTLNTTGYPLTIYYEIPVFPETTQGYQTINAFFQSLEDKFFANDFDEYRRIALEENLYFDSDFYDTTNAQIVSQTDKYVCIFLLNESYVGGVHPIGFSYPYTFRTDTGEQLSLSEVVNAAPSEIEAYILSKLEELNRSEYNGFIEMRTFQSYSADDYSFFISDGKIYVTFNRYEGLFYAAGVLPDIELTMGLKEELR